MRKLVGLVAKLPSFFDARDVLLALGLVLSAGGLYLVWTPLAFIFPGFVLTYLAVFTNGAE